VDSLHTLDSRLKVIVDSHKPASVLGDIFEPYIIKEVHQQSVELSDVYDSILTIQQSPWFNGVVVPAPDLTGGTEDEKAQYQEFITQWFKALKRESTERALNKASARMK
jgi:hypothetical protein